MKQVFRNWSAAILWGFFLWFLLGISAVTYVTVRDWPPDGLSPPAAVGLCAFFWLATGMLAYAATREPFVLATINEERTLTVVLRHGLKKRRSVFSPSIVHAAKLVVSQDSEGSPYYFAEVDAGELCIHIAEGHARGKCERACERFNAAYHVKSARHAD
jgi:hypothetical protein